MNRFRKIILGASLLGMLALCAMAFGSYRIQARSSGLVYDQVSALPTARVGLVLGCSPLFKDGRTNLFFKYRIAAAAKAFESGKCSYLLVSGDNHSVDYDEPSAMKAALVERGVPEDRIVLDYAGFSTLDSIVRAKFVFGVSEVCIISQRDHVMRAIYIAQSKGMHAIGFAAQDVSAATGARAKLRESLARVRTLLDLHVVGRQPKFLGPTISVG